MADRQLYLLDTDHISLLQRGNADVRSRLLQVDVPNRCVTVISLAEQMQGRLAVIRRASSETEAARGFQRLYETMAFYQSVTVLPYDQKAAEEFNRLRTARVRIGTQDLRIAAIALSQNAALVTRNRRDFQQVASLTFVDWSA